MLLYSPQVGGNTSGLLASTSCMAWNYRQVIQQQDSEPRLCVPDAARKVIQ